MLNEATEIHDAEEGFPFFLMKTLSFLICCLIPNIALSRGLDFPAYISQFERAGDGVTLKKKDSFFNLKFFETVFRLVVHLLHIVKSTVTAHTVDAIKVPVPSAKPSYIFVI
jgi:hypothetical protein